MNQFFYIKQKNFRVVNVVNFNQRLGAAHYKRWAKYTFLCKKAKKGIKSKKFGAKFSKKVFFD